MPNPLLLAGLLLATSLCCVAPERAATREARLRAWIGQPWLAFLQEQGQPKRVEQLPDGAWVATYVQRKKKTTLVYYGNSSNRQVPSATNRGFVPAEPKPRPVREVTYLNCITTVHVSPHGLVEQVEFSGDDCS